MSCNNACLDQDPLGVRQFAYPLAYRGTPGATWKADNTFPTPSFWRQMDQPTLSGSHVRLVPLSLDHVPALCKVGLDPEIWRWTPTNVDAAAGMRAFVTEALAERDAGRAVPFAQTEAATGRVVGSTRLANIDRRHRRAEIGWTWIGRAWQRTAINTEAKLLLFTHAFEVMGCKRVEIKTDALNTQSRRAIARLGAVQEGIFRRHMITDSGRWRDTVYFSVIDEEWPAIRQRLTDRLHAGDGVQTPAHLHGS
jgi:RimJ/RimL family protein N-acetyltransferase